MNTEPDLSFQRGLRRGVGFGVLLAAGCGGGSPPAPPAPPPAPVVPAPGPAGEAAAPEPDVTVPFETEKDPVLARTMREFENLRLDPTLADLRMGLHGFRPFVVAEEEGTDGKGDGTAAMAGEALLAAYRTLRGFLKDAAGMEVPLLEDMGDQRIRVVLFADDASFINWHRRANLETNRSSTAYYQMGRSRWILASKEGLRPLHLARLATFALLHHYGRHFVQEDDDAMAREGGKPTETVQWEDNRLRSSFWWFERGLAGHVGWLAQSGLAGGESNPAGMSRETLDCLRTARERREAWPLAEYLFEDKGGVKYRSKIRGSMEWETLAAIHGAQSQVLFRTLLEGEVGRWREGFGRLLRNEVRGRSGQIYFLESFGLPKRPKDPKVEAWIREVEAACLRTEQFLLALAGAGK